MEKGRVVVERSLAALANPAQGVPSNLSSTSHLEAQVTAWRIERKVGRDEKIIHHERRRHESRKGNVKEANKDRTKDEVQGDNVSRYCMQKRANSG
jgi:hypothetical protein